MSRHYLLAEKRAILGQGYRNSIASIALIHGTLNIFFSCNEIRKTQNEHLIIVCQHLIGL